MLLPPTGQVSSLAGRQDFHTGNAKGLYGWSRGQRRFLPKRASISQTPLQKSCRSLRDRERRWLFCRLNVDSAISLTAGFLPSSSLVSLRTTVPDWDKRLEIFYCLGVLEQPRRTSPSPAFQRNVTVRERCGSRTFSIPVTLGYRYCGLTGF